LRRFVAEARALAAVDHPNVVRLFDFLPDPADPRLVMEFVPGEAMSSWLKDHGLLTPDRAAEVLAAAARGVQAAHDAGVIHRDLKPGNLLLTPDGRVKVADFGLGKRLDEADGLTRTGQLAGGTPGFMSPEQIDERFGPVGPAADVWGLGACLYAALTGRAPFPGGKSHTHYVLCEPVAPLRVKDHRIPPALEAVVLKCLEKEPSGRYLSVGEVADDLDRFRRGEPTIARPQSWAGRTWRRVRTTPRGTLFAWAVAVAAMVVGISAAIVPKSLKDDTPEKVRDRQRQQFTDRQEVTLVPKAGRPAWSEWMIERAELADSPGRDGAAYITPTDAFNVLKLFDPPGDTYRVSADLQHHSAVDATDPHTKVGLVLFHQRFTDGRVTADRFLSVTFADYDRLGLLEKGATPGVVNVESWFVFLDGNQDPPRTRHYGLTMPAHTFPTRVELPGKWRRLVAEVSPAGLRLSWGTDADAPDAELIPFAEYTAAELNEHWATHRRVERRPLPDTLQPGWQPSGGVGLLTYRSGLAFRSVTVRSSH
jgi:serine/threonine-protein kinase